MDSLTEPLAEAALTLLYALVSLGLTVAGLDAEYLGLQQLGAGETMLGAWFAFMGVVALVAAAMLARDRLLPRLRAA